MKRASKRVLMVMAAVIGVYSLYFSTRGETKDSSTAMMLSKYEVATFAGGCFWCVESDFEKVDGVIEAVSGYTGGHQDNPSYKQVSAGGTGHVEAVEIYYDSKVVSYGELLDVFWRHIDPTDPGGQFVDRGSQYASAIFYHTDDQKRVAESSKKALGMSETFGAPIVTPILPVKTFYKAEEYHQDYYKKNSVRYKAYRFYSGRDQFIKSAWKDTMDKNKQVKSMEKPMEKETMMHYSKPEDGVLKKRLSPLQYRVARENGTEPPFNNSYWENKKAGIYVDVVSGEPLFSSADKFESGTGWPSFTRPLERENVIELTDRSFFMVRREVRSRHGDSHLGHLFDDGPKPTGLRYCINSAALRFIPKEEMADQGYGEYLDKV